MSDPVTVDYSVVEDLFCRINKEKTAVKEDKKAPTEVYCTSHG